MQPAPIMTGHHHQTHRRRCHPLILFIRSTGTITPAIPSAGFWPTTTAGKPAFGETRSVSNQHEEVHAQARTTLARERRSKLNSIVA